MTMRAELGHRKWSQKWPGEDEVQASEDLKAQENLAQAGLCADTIILTMDGELLAHDIAPW